MLDRIARGLEAQFEKHRVVVWHDPGREFRAAFDDTELPGVEKIAVANSGFATAIFSTPGSSVSSNAARNSRPGSCHTTTRCFSNWASRPRAMRSSMVSAFATQRFLSDSSGFQIP